MTEEARESRDPKTAAAGREGTGPASSAPFVVGIGASAGGLEALETFFDNVPARTGLVFVVVQHLSPDYRSLMVELLSRHTTMPVVRATDGMQIAPDTVHLIPPKTDMTLFEGRLRLREHDTSSGIHLPIDTFFRSLAEDCGERAIGIVLSGTGSDGMRGVRAIKEASGMVMVQDETEAKFDGMPRSAISTGLVDFVLPVAQMPGELVAYTRSAVGVRDGGVSDAVRSDEENLQRVAEVLRRHSGIDFAHYKPATIVRRIERRMSINQIETFSDYVSALERSARERTILYKELLIGVTKFFRDTEAFEILRTEVVPAIIDAAVPDEPLRVWAPACSTGEEAYSFAMLFQDHMDATNTSREVKIFATDVDREAVEFAAAGLYPESIVADVPATRLARYFSRRGESWQVTRTLREMVVFAVHNLAKDPPLTRMDLVSCRNLLIYLQPSLQKKVLALLVYALKPRGFLLLGPSESPGPVAHMVRTVSSKWKTYRLVSTDRRPLAEAVALAAGSAVDSTHRTTRHQAEDGVLERVYQDLMSALDVRCLVLDSDFRVQHTFGNVGDIVQLRPGRATLDLLRMVPRELQTPLRSALTRAMKERREVAYDAIDMKSLGRRLAVRVRPLQGGRDHSQLLAVFFSDTVAPSAAESAEPYDSGSADQARIAHLEQELQYSKENLQATIEELETSNEELQAANEELLASNEELQSTNEELQSVNEELQTVNGEYQQKIEELTQLHNDLDNILRVSGVGMMFVDADLRIREFTPAIGRILHVMPQDAGRPLRHISSRTPGFEVAALAQQVIDGGHSVEGATRAEDGSEFVVRVVPYLAEGHEAQGAVVHTIDVTSLRQAERFLHAALDELALQIAAIDPAGRITIANRGWREAGASGVARGAVGDNYLDLLAAWGGAEADALRSGIEAVLHRRQPRHAGTFTVRGPGGERTYALKVVPVEAPYRGVLVACQRVTHAGAGPALFDTVPEAAPGNDGARA